MLIEKLAGLVAVRRRTVALCFGCAVGKPLFCSVAFSFVAGDALARDPEVDDLSHKRARRLPNEGEPQVPMPKEIVANCADTVAMTVAGIKPAPECC